MKENRVSIRIQEHLDKQIIEFAKHYFPTQSAPFYDYSKAVRFLCQLSLIISKRLDDKQITTLFSD